MFASPAHCWSANMVNWRKAVVGEDAVGIGAEVSEVSRKPRIAYFYRNVSDSDNNFSKHISIVVMLLLHIMLRLYIHTNTMPA
jgi:hypothetical protein